MVLAIVLLFGAKLVSGYRSIQFNSIQFDSICQPSTSTNASTLLLKLHHTDRTGIFTSYTLSSTLRLSNHLSTMSVNPIDSFDPTVHSKSLLSDKAILDHIQQGSVVIEPFVMENLSTSR